MKNEDGGIVYVGKAVNLRNRVRSYFQRSAGHTAKTAFMVKQIADFEYIVTDSEVEALVLESNLIKKHKPKYNIRIRDDKHYPYIKITLHEPFPRLLIARRIKKDGARYFGPYPNATAARETIDLLRRVFKIRSCKKRLTGAKEGRACLNYHIKRCGAPCQGEVSRDEYLAAINNVIRFLSGKQDEIVRMLRLEMEQAAEELKFEKAAKLRDQLSAVLDVLEKQKVISAGLEDVDVIAMARGVEDTCVTLFKMRGGKVVGHENIFMSGRHDALRQEVLSAFIQQYYSMKKAVPKEIWIDDPIADLDIIEKWLTQERGSKVYVKVPQRGEKKSLCQMAHKNAMNAVEERWNSRKDKKEIVKRALEELAFYLKLPHPPGRIECYDISNTQGTQSVGSMVVLVEGQPCNSHYRRFKIRGIEGPNDFAMMNQVLRRRLDRLSSSDESFSLKPDLIIVDGGKGQLSAACEALASAGHKNLSIVGLAKREEHLFLPQQSEPVVLPRDSQSLYLVQRIRDEAHRFAITYHRRLRAKRQVESELEQVPGIGPARRKNLLKHFGTIKAIKKAGIDDLESVSGMTRGSAEALFNHLRQQRKMKFWQE